MTESLSNIGENALVTISGLKLSYGRGLTVFDGLDWLIMRGENWLIGGESGSGKSALGKVVGGVIDGGGSVSCAFSKNLSFPAVAYFVDNWYKFSDVEGDRNFYYQQRYNKNASNPTLTVYAELVKFGEERGLDFSKAEPILQKFGFEKCRETELLELSSGEHKKLQLVMALWYKPQLLILDEPYTGLDKLSRANLNEIVDSYAAEGITFIIITNDPNVPTAINRYGKIENGKLKILVDACELRPRRQRVEKPVPYFLQKSPQIDCQTMIEIKNVSVKYGEKTVLDNVSWRVNAGEKWALQGHNGSGKSTLLSLIDGDHPQAYTNEIWLFGKKRGSGESIWDIKEKIGIISPEMHWFFDQNATVWNTVASGFFDSIGWYLKVSDEQSRKLNSILDFFDLLSDKDKLLNTLPLGKQRLALLARTMIKNPPLLILDEPCQGLDAEQTEFFNSILDKLSVYGKTIIYVGHYETQMPSCLDHKLVLDKGSVSENL